MALFGTKWHGLGGHLSQKANSANELGQIGKWVGTLSPTARQKRAPYHDSVLERGNGFEQSPATLATQLLSLWYRNGIRATSGRLGFVDRRVFSLPALPPFGELSPERAAVLCFTDTLCQTVRPQSQGMAELRFAAFSGTLRAVVFHDASCHIHFRLAARGPCLSPVVPLVSIVSIVSAPRELRQNVQGTGPAISTISGSRPWREYDDSLASLRPWSEADICE